MPDEPLNIDYVRSHMQSHADDETPCYNAPRITAALCDEIERLRSMVFVLRHRDASDG